MKCALKEKELMATKLRAKKRRETMGEVTGLMRPSAKIAARWGEAILV